MTLSEAFLSATTGNVPKLPNVLYLNRSNVSAVQNGKPFSVVITEASEIDGAKPLTIIVEGGNVFIDQNIKSPIGIITLEDPRVTQAHANIYVCACVTEVRAQIRAEGSILSYGQDKDINTPAVEVPMNDPVVCKYKTDADFYLSANGFPKFVPASAERAILRNQLTFFGSVVSLN